MDVQLILLVSKYPILYDLSYQEYKNAHKKNDAWKEITQELFGNTDQVLVEKVKTKWKNLRDTYVKALKKKDKPNVKPWKYEKDMSFLFPHLTSRHPRLSDFNKALDLSYCNLKSECKSEFSVTDMDEMETDNWEYNRSERLSAEEEILQAVETVWDETPRKNKVRPRGPSLPGVHFMDSGVAHLDEEMPRQQTLQMDSTDYFFLGISATAKKLKPKRQIALRRAIANLVMDAELDELNKESDEER